MIATNGRAPYNNKEVELITQPEGFDPNGYAFQNNWVNNLLKSGKKSPRQHASEITGVAHAEMDAEDELSGIPSASVTATTVFLGHNPAHDSGQLSQRKGNNKESSGHERLITPGSGSFQALQNNLMSLDPAAAESPITMMDMSEDKTVLGLTGENVIRGPTSSQQILSGANVGGAPLNFQPSSSQRDVTDTSADNILILNDKSESAKAARPPLHRALPDDAYFR